MLAGMSAKASDIQGGLDSVALSLAKLRTVPIDSETVDIEIGDAITVRSGALTRRMALVDPASVQVPRLPNLEYASCIEGIPVKDLAKAVR